MKTEQEMTAFRQGYRTVVYLINEIVEEGKFVKGGEDYIKLLTELKNTLKKNEDTAVGLYVIREDY